MHRSDGFVFSNESRLVAFVSVAIVMFAIFYFQKKIVSSCRHFCCCNVRARSVLRSRNRVLRNLGIVREELEDRMDATRLGLVLLDRDFNGDDYEILSQLDHNVEHRRNLGASVAEIGRLPTHVVQEAIPDDRIYDDDKCSVCLSTFERGDVKKILPCLHHFHKECIDKWLGECATCPICKFPAIG